jgi:hypothetical protein
VGEEEEGEEGGEELGCCQVICIELRGVHTAVGYVRCS